MQTNQLWVVSPRCSVRDEEAKKVGFTTTSLCHVALS